MKVAAICCTYKRPRELATVVECFLRQDYPQELRELIVLDDADQYDQQRGPGWQIVSVAQRFRTLGEKRNASAALIGADVGALFVWDDDDIYLPWHISAGVAALKTGAAYTIPTRILTYRAGCCFVKSNQCLFHGAWSFTREAFERVHGYPFMQSGQDQGLLKRFKKAKLLRADPLDHDPRPSYVYRWHDTHREHISALGENGYARLARRKVKRVGTINPKWGRDWLKLAQNAKGEPRASARG